MGILPNRENATALSPERAAAVRSELTAILKSSYFSGSKRCQDFFEFVVHQALDGNYEYLTERFLGAELFGRPINYETGTDSIVRVRANDVRRRLAQFYSEGHGGSQVTIDLVSGSYVPEFHWLEQEPFRAGLALSLPNETASRPALPSDGIFEASHKPSSQVQTKSLIWILAGLIAIAVSGFFLGQWLKQRELDRSLYPLKYAPSMNALWSEFLDSGHQTDVVLSDSSFQLLQDIGNRSFSLDDYINRSYISQLQSQNPNGDMRTVLNLIAPKNFGSD